MSSLELKSLMSLGAKELEKGQVREANCDLAERQGRILHRRPIKFLAAAKAKISKGKRTQVD